MSTVLLLSWVAMIVASYRISVLMLKKKDLL
jgi:hypothetical protein